MFNKRIRSKTLIIVLAILVSLGFIVLTSTGQILSGAKPFFQSFVEKINAKPNKEYHTISFDSDGGSNVASQEVKNNEWIIRPANPTKTGYDFLGWVDKNNQSSYFDFTTPIRSDVQLLAKWGLKSGYHTVKFNSNGGSSVAMQTVRYGATATKPGDPYKLCYTFNGWRTTNGNTYNFNNTVTSSIELTAYWTYNSNCYIVTFDSNGGSNIDSKAVYKGNGVGRPADPTRVGYEFIGWYLDGNLYNFNNSVNGNLKLVARWVEDDNYITATFDSNGGSSINSQRVKKGNTVDYPGEPTRNGYVFEGWYYENGNKFDFNTKINNNLKLVAHWSERSNYVTVTFDSNGGSYIGTNTIRKGDTASKPTNPTRNGYIFEGWYYENGNKFDFNTKINNNLKLVAKWRSNESRTIIYEHVKYSDWKEGYSSSSDAENKQERLCDYSKVKKESYQSFSYILDTPSQTKNYSYKYTIQILNANSNSSYIPVIEERYLTGLDFDIYMLSRHNKVSIFGANKNGIIDDIPITYKQHSLVRNNFSFTISDAYRSNGRYYVDIEIYVNNTYGLSPFYSYEIDKDVYFVPIAFTLEYRDQNNSKRDLCSKESSYSGYEKDYTDSYAWYNRKKTTIWSRNKYEPGYTYTGNWKYE